MSAGIFVFDVIATLLLSGGLLFSHGNWLRQHLVVTVAVLVAWYFSFLIIFVLPLDVSSTTYRQCLNATNDTLASLSTTVSPLQTTTTPKLAPVGPTSTIITEKDINQTRSWGSGSPYLSSPEAAAAAGLRIPPQDDPPKHVCQEPYSLMEPSVLPNLWRIVYWTSQFLTWLLLPLMQSFTQAGEFTTWGKLRSAMRDNIIYYTSYVVIAIVLVIYISLKPDLHLNWERTKTIAAATSNTWGLFVLVLMLGYGLVEVPRNCWNRSQKGYQLNRAYFKIAKLMSEKTDAEELLEDVLSSVYVISNMIGQADMRRPMVETILRKIPLEMMERIRRRRGGTVETVDFGSDPPTEKTLIKLHRQVIKALQTHHRTDTLWNDWTNKVFELEDVNRNMVSNEHKFVHTLSRQPTCRLYTPAIEWYWRCLVSPLLLRFAACLTAAMSIFVVWSEMTFFSIKPTLSVFSGLVSLAASNENYFAVEAICLCTIFYLCLCTYYTVFNVRVLNYYYLAGSHQSDEYTLLFSGALLCRLTPPLCLNFLSLIHMDSHVIKSQIMETAYTRVMGHMDVVSIISDYFNIYFPIGLVVLTTATYFSLGARLLTALGFQQFLSQDSDVTLEIVDEGKEHIKREKRRRQRLIESQSRRREFVSRFGDAEERGGSDVRQRASDIVKLRSNNSSSPERSLLGHRSPTASAMTSADTFRSRSGIDVERGGGRIEDDDEDDDAGAAGSPQRSSGFFREAPPRNIFDDL